MDISTLLFWIQFSILLFAILVMIIFFMASQLHKKRIEKKLDDVFFEVRELNLRVTIVETRLEERIPQVQFFPPAPNLLAAPKPKRGRPRKNPEE